MVATRTSRLFLLLVLCYFGLVPLRAAAQGDRLRGIAALVRSTAQDRELPAYRPFHTRALDAATARLAPSATLFNMDGPVLEELLRTAPNSLELVLPTRQGELRLRLVSSTPLTDQFSVIAASTGRPVEVPAGLHYVGLVNNDPNTFAAISIFQGQVMGLVNDGQGDHVLGPMEHSDTHIYYAANELREHFAFTCTTPESDTGYSPAQLAPDEGDRSVHCVRFYWEVNNDVYVAKGGMTNTVNYATALFNQSAALYLNDGLSITLNQLYVWDVAAPYTGTTIYEQVTLFQNNRNGFNGDLATLLGLAGGGGRAASLAGLCNGDNDNSMCYAGIQTSYQNVPTYSWSVFVVSHEEGHLLGSSHTHACVWNGNNTQIDGCGPTAGYSEGGTCPIGPIPPTGGTIMSYCHLNAVGINFLNGFGPQPLAVITNAIASAPCVINCAATACGPVFGAVASNITTTSAQLTWMPIANATSYKLQWKAANASVWTTVQGISGTNYALSGLTPWTSYQFQVKTNCASDTSAFAPTAGFTTAANSLSDGLVACYPFNGSPDDQSGHGHHGVLFGPVPAPDRNGVPNAAYAFNGVSDRIDVADLNTWPISNEISISFWVKTLESKGNAVVWAWPDIGSDRLLVNPNFLHGGSNDFSWTFGNTLTTGHCNLTGYPFRAEWEHYVVTSSAASNTMKTYRNGVLIDEEQHASAIMDLDRTLCIGGNGSPVFFLHGSLDDLTIHDRELTAGEVYQLYVAGTPCAQRILVAPKVFLEGPYVQATQLMNDALRTAGLLPSAEPYSALGYTLLAGGSGVVQSAGVGGAGGNNAVCDWVLVELRQPVSPYAVLATRSALLQRDGDVVGFDGVSPVPFDAAPGSYMISIRHRDHLGVMTANAVTLSASATTIDFTNPGLPTYGANAQKAVGTRMVLWAGDASGDGQLKYTGTGNDRDPMLTAVGGTTPNNVVNATYDRRDTNLDGTIKYTGANNDRDVILTNVGSTVPTNTRTQQLP